MNHVAKILQDLSIYGLEKLGLYYSRYRGFVYDNKDPQGFGRLLVSVPEIFGDGILNTWAWPSSNYSGKNYGMQCLPRINDLIWVEFEKGNPRKPVWSYGYFGKNEKPENLKNPNLIWFVTPGQHKVIISDEDGYVKIISPGGAVLELNGDKISLGKETESTHPVAFGDTTKNKLESLIDILKNATIFTGDAGPQPFLPPVITALEQLKTSLHEIESSKVTTE